MWDNIKIDVYPDDVTEGVEQNFLDHPERHHVVIAVTGDQGENAREWASYLLDESTGAYNHPVNRFGEIVRVLAGADKIGESNDFRSTRHMFFMNPETDVVKLVQKFGRVCRSSDPTKYPYYKYGFHRDHLGEDEKGVPIVHYVTLALPDETKKAFTVINNKAEFYNAYGRLLARGEGDAGLVVREHAPEDSWKNAIKELRGPSKPVNFNAGVACKQEQDSWSVLSNLYGSAEWDWAMIFFKSLGTEKESTAAMSDTIWNWLKDKRSESEKWSIETLKATISRMFPEYESINTKHLLKDRTFDSVPTGVVPRLLLNALFVQSIGKNNKPVLENIFNDMDKTQLLADNLRVGTKPDIDDTLMRDYVDYVKGKTTEDGLREVMETKFATGSSYLKRLLATGKDVLKEVTTSMKGITIPYGYTLEDSDAILMEIRNDLAAGVAKNE